MIDRHFHWKFLAYNDEEALPNGNIRGTGVSVIGYLDEATAKIAAQDIVQRQHWRLFEVWECPACGYQQKAADTMASMVAAIKECH